MALVICDVGPRDGLQNERETLPPSVRAELVNRLAAAGLPKIEAVSFVRDDRVPQMAGAEEVVAAIERREGTVYSGLVLNRTGYARFRATRLEELHFTLAATETFNQRNANRSIEESLKELEQLRSDRPLSVSISVSFGCPFEGVVRPDDVLRLAERVGETADEIVFADTIGVAVPRQGHELVTRAAGLPPPVGPP